MTSHNIFRQKMRIAAILLFFQLSMGMLIPEEAEMLDGYGGDRLPVSSDEDYFEAKMMSFGPLSNSMRNKRATNSNATRNSVHIDPNGRTLVQKKRPLRKLVEWWKTKLNQINLSRSSRSSSYSSGSSSSRSSKRSSNEYTENWNNIVFIPSRHRRSITVEEPKPNKQPESIPTPLKLTKDSNGFASSRNGPSAASLVGKFTRSPFEYSKVQHEEDSIAMDTSPTSINEGIKSRTPRVNFVTQQKKSLDHDDSKVSATKNDFYKTPPLLHNSKELPTPVSSSERYSDKTSTARPVDTYSKHKGQGPTGNRYDE